MRPITGILGLACAVSLACASGPRPLKISKQPFQNTGLHLVQLQGRGELLIAPDVERVRKQLRETEGAIVRCQVTVDKRADAPDLAAAKAKLEGELCEVAKRGIVARPRPKVGPGSEAPARIASQPGPDVMYVEVWLLDVEGDAQGLEPTPRSTFSLRLSESVGGKPVMRYYEQVRGGAGDPLEALVDRSLDRLYSVYESVLDAPLPDVASSPR